jgi:hypothetical protein
MSRTVSKLDRDRRSQGHSYHSQPTGPQHGLRTIVRTPINAHIECVSRDSLLAISAGTAALLALLLSRVCGNDGGEDRNDDGVEFHDGSGRRLICVGARGISNVSNKASCSTVRHTDWCWFCLVGDVIVACSDGVLKAVVARAYISWPAWLLQPTVSQSGGEILFC